MNVCVDQKKCQSVGICVKICPEVFRFEVGSKKARALMHSVPAALEEKCKEAALKCPEKAILIEC